MPRTPGLVPLGDTGNIHIPWKQLVSAKKKAEKFREKADPGTDDDLRRLAGSTYSDKIYQHFLTWGASLPDRDLYKRCLARGLIGADPHIMEDLMVAIKDSAVLDEPGPLQEPETDSVGRPPGVEDLSDRVYRLPH